MQTTMNPFKHCFKIHPFPKSFSWLNSPMLATHLYTFSTLASHPHCVFHFLSKYMTTHLSCCHTRNLRSLTASPCHSLISNLTQANQVHLRVSLHPWHVHGTVTASWPCPFSPGCLATSLAWTLTTLLHLLHAKSSQRQWSLSWAVRN